LIAIENFKLAYFRIRIAFNSFYAVCTIFTCLLKAFMTAMMILTKKFLRTIHGLKILIVDGDGESTDMTSNIVYHEVFRNVS
jgi:hypothetical protein